MIVYVVLEHDNGMGVWTVHIASSEEKAAAWIDANPSSYGDGSYDIDVWEVDKGIL